MPSAPSAPQVQALVSFLEHESEPMIVLDVDYNILASNTAYQRQFGIAGHSAAGQKCYRVSHHYDVPCDLAGEHCPMKKAQEKRGPDRVLHIHHTPRGPEHVNVELRPILDDAHEVVAYVERLVTVRNASARTTSDGLVGRSPAFVRALEALQRAAPAMLPVLLLGESGSGKELFARALHEASDRAAGPFVVVDCSGLTETLFESELFGYEKGAFTGAQARKHGLVETARGGTLFLDEIGDVPLGMQVKLLRLIESGTYRRVGGLETLHSDFRLVAATHKPLADMVADGRFRQDLYYRISAYPIHLPALRERGEDIPLLIESVLQRLAKMGRPYRVTPEALAALQSYSWPGNIRELRNVLERATLFADDRVIGLAQLPDFVLHTHPGLPAPGLATRAVPTGAKLTDQALATYAAGFAGTRAELARALGMSERTLYRRLKSLQLA
ncbi:sigma 54-interacting transcriptional regulator [Massilia solisilvae]|uniref:Sigma 54-interacting transcriptional regulator n=1 Tax=Massilia solisilvae TaxID=1811225 RepID=A0ABT2BIC5_9BURK|nr:sigma 54-interacting transcriptional regulator [Massilia solisilvae]MCS0608212.1 sigma 54-interacting transcriptional regulator [Massilia solisilvae]